MRIELPEAVLPFFRDAGWLGWREPSSDTGLADHPAELILSQFQGLSVGECAAGEECARSDILFGRNEELEQDETVQQWQLLLGTRLVCIGEVHHGHGALFMDSRGACYQNSLVHDAFSFAGPSFAIAMQRILLGRKTQAMLAPDQESASIYGETIGRGHPHLHRYEAGPPEE